MEIFTENVKPRLAVYKNSFKTMGKILSKHILTVDFLFIDDLR